MRFVAVFSLVALAALAGGCMSIGSDGPATQGRLLPVGADAADFSRAYALSLNEDILYLEDVRSELRVRGDTALGDKQAYYNESAAVWSDPHYKETERPPVSTAYSALGQECQDRADRYDHLIRAYGGRTCFLFTELHSAERWGDKYDAMRLVAP